MELIPRHQIFKPPRCCAKYLTSSRNRPHPLTLIVIFHITFSISKQSSPEKPRLEHLRCKELTSMVTRICRRLASIHHLFHLRLRYIPPHHFVQPFFEEIRLISYVEPSIINQPLHLVCGCTWWKQSSYQIINVVCIPW